MLKELSLLKWQEKATKYTGTKMGEMQTNVSSLEESLKAERLILLCQDLDIHLFVQ